MRKLMIYHKISWIALKFQYKVKDTPPPLPSCTHGKTVDDHDSTEFSTQKEKCNLTTRKVLQRYFTHQIKSYIESF